jgi:hypothetical protein
MVLLLMLLKQCRSYTLPSPAFSAASSVLVFDSTQYSIPFGYIKRYKKY